MKYLKKSAGYIVLIIGLLFLQAYCDLSLPDYTSKVINVLNILLFMLPNLLNKQQTML